MQPLHDGAVDFDQRRDAGAFARDLLGIFVHPQGQRHDLGAHLFGKAVAVVEAIGVVWKLRADGLPTGHVGVAENIVKASKGQAVSLGYDHERKRDQGELDLINDAMALYRKALAQ